MTTSHEQDVSKFAERVRRVVALELEAMRLPANALVSLPHQGMGVLVQTKNGLRPISISETQVTAPEAELRRQVGVQLARAFQDG